MAKTNSSNQQYTNNADGFTLGGGTTARFLSLISGNVTITGTGSNTYTFPVSTDTLAGLGTAQTFSVAQTFGANITLSDAVNVVVGTTTGTMWGTSASSKQAWNGNTPIAKQGATVDLGTVISNYGLRTGGTAYPITTTGTVNFGGSWGFSGATPSVVSTGWSTSGGTPTKVLTNGSPTAINASAVLAQLLTDLIAKGIISA